MATVVDPTDPGTQRPNEAPAKQTDNHLEPMLRLKRRPKIGFKYNANNAQELFELFFSDHILQIVINNNKNAHYVGLLKLKRKKSEDLKKTHTC